MPLSWFVLLAGPFVGSFLGLLAIRIPAREPLLWGRSRCDHCGHALRAADLVPLLSWLWLRGRCRYCREPIGVFAPLMEIAALLVAIMAVTQTSGLVLLASCGLGWTLLLLAAIDWRVQLLPDILTLPLCVAGLAASWAIAADWWPDHVIGAAAGFLSFALIALAYRAWRGREGLGLGDAKLMAALGAWVSWIGLPTVLLWGSVLGLAYALAQTMRGQRLALSDRIPFGSFLAVGGWLVWLYGPLWGGA